MKFVEMDPNQLPLALLLEADPAEQRIAAYLPGAWGFAALAGNEVVGACAAGLVGEQTAEIFNIAVAPKCQQQGIGSSLLHFVLTSLAGKGVCRVELGTGSFGHQPDQGRPLLLAVGTPLPLCPDGVHPRLSGRHAGEQGDWSPGSAPGG